VNDIGVELIAARRRGQGGDPSKYWRHHTCGTQLFHATWPFGRNPSLQSTEKTLAQYAAQEHTRRRLGRRLGIARWCTCAPLSWKRSLIPCRKKTRNL